MLPRPGRPGNLLGMSKGIIWIVVTHLYIIYYLAVVNFIFFENKLSKHDKQKNHLLKVLCPFFSEISIN
jgi:hypothetical protein